MINIMNLADGNIVDKLNRELQKVAQNIVDKNTDPKKERKITLTLSFKPNDNRDFVITKIQTKTSLAPELGEETQIIIGKDSEGELHLNEVRQQSIFTSADKSKVVNIK
ncbi:MAG: hypothetical protein SA378_08810 [Sedimentibacter sp.]|uniref:hypothetical protein n=1 Tax=Sedimentibacter sp. TaxID=1960295 RepID=UPI002980D7A0|nr:hypothetical protein [Sedimentibacter sp.]MDW5300222.1 hypothetical protein [Sedimentibacter sp.]